MWTMDNAKNLQPAPIYIDSRWALVSHQAKDCQNIIYWFCLITVFTAMFGNRHLLPTLISNSQQGRIAGHCRRDWGRSLSGARLHIDVFLAGTNLSVSISWVTSTGSHTAGNVLSSTSAEAGVMDKRCTEHHTWKHGQHKETKHLSKCVFVWLCCQLPGKKTEKCQSTSCQRRGIKPWTTTEQLPEAIIAKWPHYSFIDLCCANPRVFQAFQGGMQSIHDSSSFPEAKLFAFPVCWQRLLLSGLYIVLGTTNTFEDPNGNCLHQLFCKPPSSHCQWCCFWAKQSVGLGQ